MTTSMTSEAPQGRLLPMLCADGPWQMALDQMLLEQTDPLPVLRFYRWSGAWLSLGRHQRQWPDHWNDLAAGGRLSIVRRPSGGQAVLHAGGLTYALIWPGAPRGRRQAYREACGWLVEGFRSLGDDLRFGDEAATGEDANCFARSTAADLVDRRGIKRIGSAQRWQRGRLLQHGEILLDPPADLWHAVFGDSTPAPAPAAAAIPRQGLDQHLLRALQRQWPAWSWSEQPLTPEESQELERRVSASAACIDSTTWGSIARPMG